MRWTLVGGALMALAGLVGSARAATLAQVFVPDTLDATVAHLETMTGPAWRVAGDHRWYKVDGCVLEVVAPGNAIQSLGLDVGPRCAPDLSSFTMSDTRLPAFPLTVNQAEAAFGQPVYHADCMSLCGNASEPSLLAYIPGYHANNFIDVLLGMPQTTGPAIQAAEAWSTEMTRAKGEDYVIDGRYNCSPEFQESAARLFRNLVVGHVTVGHNLGPAATCPDR